MTQLAQRYHIRNLQIERESCASKSKDTVAPNQCGESFLSKHFGASDKAAFLESITSFHVEIFPGGEE